MGIQGDQGSQSTQNRVPEKRELHRELHRFAEEMLLSMDLYQVPIRKLTYVRLGKEAHKGLEETICGSQFRTRNSSSHQPEREAHNSWDIW